MRWDNHSAAGRRSVVKPPRPRRGRFPLTLEFLGATLRGWWLDVLAGRTRLDCDRLGHFWQPLRLTAEVGEEGIVVVQRCRCAWCGQSEAFRYRLTELIAGGGVLSQEERP